MSFSGAETEEIVAAVSDVLGVEPGTIGPQTLSRDIEAWDSFGHVRIVLALEALYGIRLTMAEIEAADGIGALAAVVGAARARAAREA